MSTRWHYLWALLRKSDRARTDNSELDKDLTVSQKKTYTSE